MENTKFWTCSIYFEWVQFTVNEFKYYSGLYSTLDPCIMGYLGLEKLHIKWILHSSPSILGRQLRDPDFFQKCGTCCCCIEKYHNFERNEDCATVFLKWTDFSKDMDL